MFHFLAQVLPVFFLWFLCSCPWIDFLSTTPPLWNDYSLRSYFHVLSLSLQTVSDKLFSPAFLYLSLAISLGFWRTREIVASLPHKFLFKPLLQLGCVLEVFTEGRLPVLHNEFKFKLDRRVETKRDASCVAVIGKYGDPAWQGLGISTWSTLSSEQQKLTKKEQTQS